MNSSQQSIMANARIFLIFFILLFSISSFSTPVGPSSIEWTQTNTKHFRIIHDKKQQDLGLYYAQVAETAYSNLSTVFKTLPEVVTLVLADNTDNSNGNATVFPYPLIFAFPVQVGSQDALSEAGDWGEELITHELAHVAQLYPYSATGYKIARAIFGSIISPNLLTPNWWKEGMAVEMETQFSRRGRTRSYLQDAQIRSYVTKNTLEKFTLGQANEALVTWPYGNRRYFFGSMLMSQIAHEGNLQKKPDAIGQIVLDQSYRAPYQVNSPVQSVLGLKYSELYDKTLQDYRKNSEKQMAILNQVPTSNLSIIDESLLQSRYVQYQESQNLIGFIGTTDMKSSIHIYKQNSDLTLTPLKLKRLPAEDIGSFSFHPTESKLVYSKTHQVTLQQDYSDLYIYDMALEKSEKLTLKERARDPVYSPDGQMIIFTHTANGLTELKQILVLTKETKPLLAVGMKFRLNSYSFKSPHEIFYTLRDENGDQSLHLLDLNTLVSQKISAPTQIRFVKFKNNWLYFNSTENGVANIYRAQVQGAKLKSVQPLTHYLTGALNFDVDDQHQRVFATVISDKGPVVASTIFLAEKTKLPIIQNDILARYQNKPDQPADLTTTTSDYSIWPYIYPRYWIPFVSNNVTGDGALLQAMTSASDPLGFHSYAAQLNYDTQSRKTGFSLSYLNAQWDWEYSLSALQTQQLFGIDNYVQKNFYSFAVFPDTIALSEDFLFSLGATVNQTDDSIANTNHLGGFLQIVYDSTKQRINHFYPMAGMTFITKYQSLIDQNDQKNSRYGNYSQVISSLTTYNHLFFPKDHSLLFKIDGLYTFEDVSTRFGTSNLSLPGSPEALPLFMIRGYQAGQFLGTQMVTMNLEYRFPIKDFSAGGSTFPFFVKYLTAGVVADGLVAKGFGYNKNKLYEPIKLTDEFFSAGLEARLSTTVGYLLPLTFIYGLYFPFNHDFTEEKTVSAISLQLGGF